jgi:tetratricopeptide (TPR) repeat protein
MDPTFLPARWYLGLAYEQKSMDRESIEELEEALRLSGGGALLLAALGHAHAAFGRKAEAEKVLVRLEQMSEQSYVSLYPVAAIHAALGDPDSAFERLEEAFVERSHFLTFLKVDPHLDPLREDPRFGELVRRAGLPGAGSYF